MADQNPTRKLVVNKLLEIKSGEKNGRPWTISKVEAENADGSPINDNLKTFDDLPLGQPIEVEVEKQESEQYGTSYMLRMPRMTMIQVKQILGEHKAALEIIDERLDALEGNGKKEVPADRADAVKDVPEAKPEDKVEDIPF